MPMHPNEKKFYDENGYLIVRGAVQGQELQNLTHELESLKGFVESGQYRIPHLAEDEGIARVIFNPYDFSQTLRNVVNRQDMVDRAQGMLNGSVQLHHSKLMCKAARTGTPQPPHQDYYYWQGHHANQVAVFVCIDPSTEANGCLRLYPGTQKLGLLPHHEEYHETTGERHFVCDLTDEMIAQEVKCIGEPGDVIFFGSLTIHRSDGNQSEQSRRGVIFEYDELGNLEATSPQPPVQWEIEPCIANH